MAVLPLICMVAASFFLPAPMVMGAFFAISIASSVEMEGVLVAISAAAFVMPSYFNDALQWSSSHHVVRHNLPLVAFSRQ
jgi:hypothetical protein